MSSRVVPILGSILFFFIAPGIVAGGVPWWLSGWRMADPLLGLPAERILGGLLIALGVVCLLDSFARFAWVGRGTPAPVAPTETLVVSGLYRYVRNPMYVAVLSIILGQALLLGNTRLLTYAAFSWVFFHLFVLLYEEPTLRSKYGESYGAYQANVRRWWPRLHAWRGDAH